MNTPHQPFNLAAKFADQDQAKQVYTQLQSELKKLRFDAHVSRVIVKNEMYVSFLHEGEERSIPAQVLQAVRRVLSQGQLTALPPDAIANIQARRAERRAQGIGVYESHEPTESIYQYPAIRDRETKEIVAEFPEQGTLISEQPYASIAPGSPVYAVKPEDVPEEIRQLAQQHLAQRKSSPNTTDRLSTLPNVPAPGHLAPDRQPTQGKVIKPLIERYLTHLRVARENALARISKVVMSKNTLESNLALAQAYGDIYSAMAEQALKYRLAASAQAMIEALRPRPLLLEEMSINIMTAVANHTHQPDPDIATPVLHIPTAAIWMELEQPIRTNAGEICGLFFTCADREIERRLEQPQTPIMQETLKKAGKLAHEDYRWSLHFIDRDGTPRSVYQYFETSQKWEIIPDGDPCPLDECEVDEETSDLTGRVYKHVSPCIFCGTILAYWRSWFTTALLASQGEFAATEEREWPRARVETSRKVKRPASGKYDEIQISHDYYLVSFDASVRRVRKAAPEQEREATPRGSWVEAAREVDMESVVYVRHEFGKSERKLDPERNPRWKQKRTVEVKAYAKSVPMRVDNLQKRIIRVVASQYRAQPSTAGREQS